MKTKQPNRLWAATYDIEASGQWLELVSVKAIERRDKDIWMDSIDRQFLECQIE